MNVYVQTSHDANSRTPGSLVHGTIRSARGGLTIARVTAGIEYSQPVRPKWSGTLGLIFQHAGARDDKGNPIIRDIYNSPLTASGNAYDDMLIAKFEGVYTDSDWACSTSFKCIRGHVVGNFPPHEAFAIGGINSVRGYEEGAVGSGRSYMVGSGEISFRMFGPVEGVLFADYGNDLGSGPTVRGDPAGARGKPGNGCGFGAGIRVDSPLGPLRLEYAFNDKLASRFHFGVGYRN
ncbi:outer envelope protein 80, chloroplastic-like [Elaeis guineensis]|uniref:outer envelope protein 80, chloroplastic-like n=1 Tax=Elaeis guineensis var. tenera TaxID=51953 RepID=UPI003C6CF8C4